MTNTQTVVATTTAVATPDTTFAAADDATSFTPDADTASVAGGEVEVRPCEHNDWDDVRTRKGYKVLRCRECQKKWKLLSSNVPRCMPFLHDCCDKAEACPLLHVRRKKHTISERYEKFGDTVLEGVSIDIAARATVTTLSDEDSRSATTETASHSDAHSSAPDDSDAGGVNTCATDSAQSLSLDAAAASVLNPYMKFFQPAASAGVWEDLLAGATVPVAATPVMMPRQTGRQQMDDDWRQLAATTQALVGCSVWN